MVGYHLVSALTRHGWIARLAPPASHVIAGGAGYAVDLFFVLSGYILAETYGVRADAATFFVHRAARVLPLHWVVLTALVVGVAATEHAGGVTPRPGAFDWRTLPYQYTLTSVWVRAAPWNVPTWSLNAELVAYLLFPLLQQVGRRTPALPMLVLGLGLVAADMALIGRVGFRTIGYLAILRGVLGFAAGFMLRLAIAGRPIPLWLTNLCVLEVGAAACAGAYRLALIPGAALIVALGSPAKGFVHRALSTPIPLWLGRISFSIYLAHYPLLLVFAHLMGRTPLLRASPAMVLASGLLYVAATLIVAQGTWRWVEVPARRGLRQWWDGAHQRALAAPQVR